MSEKETEVRTDSSSKIVSNQLLDKYMKEFMDDIKLTESNLREKSMMSTTIRAKWLQYLFKEYENLKKAKDYKAKILESKVKTSDRQSVLRLKSEDKISSNDERVVKLDELITITKSNIDYLEHVQNILHDFPWDIKNKIELLKLERI